MIKVTRYEKAIRVEMVLNEEVVSWLSINQRKCYLAGKEFTVGAIGGVGTKEEHRHQGYSRAVLDKTLQVMSEDGTELSLLFGIGDYYHRWGYVSCLPQNRLSIATWQAERATLYHHIRPLLETDFPAILEIYKANNQNRTGAIVRDKDYRKFRLGSTFGEKAIPYILEKEGVIEGYIVLDEAKHSVNLAEIGAATPSVYYSVLAFLAEEAIKKRVSTITGNIPQDHQFALFARSFGLTINVNYVYDADGMGRIINQEKVLKGLEETLFKRCGLDPKKQVITIKTDLGVTVLGQGDFFGSLRTDQMTLTQLLFGYLSVNQTVFTQKLVTDIKIEDLEKMFPLQIAHLWGPDKF